MDYPEQALVKEVYTPTLCLDDAQLSDVKKLEVGKTYTLTIQARVTNKSERESMRDKKTRTHADLALTNIKIGRGKSYEKNLSQMAGE